MPTGGRALQISLPRKRLIRSLIFAMLTPNDWAEAQCSGWFHWIAAMLTGITKMPLDRGFFWF
jgi:hypothetical protein